MIVMGRSIRITTLCIWSAWIFGSVLAILGAVKDVDAGITGLLIVIYGTIIWSHRWFVTVKHRELVAFDLGRQHERASTGRGGDVVPIPGHRP